MSPRLPSSRREQGAPGQRKTKGTGTFLDALIFDAANCETASVDVGTNGGSAWTRPSGVPTDSATVLVTTIGYNSAGWEQDVTDPRGIDNRTIYDNLQRTTQTVEDYTNGTVTAETNKTTDFTYDGSSHMLTLQALEVGGGSQNTQVVDGVTTGASSNVNSNDILATAKYPDPTTGAASSSYEETYTVDALGENLTYTDRAGNVHGYSYDILNGRETGTLPSGMACGSSSQTG